MFLDLTWLRVLIIVSCKVSNDADNECYYLVFFQCNAAELTKDDFKKNFKDIFAIQETH